jgi:hypothetical protein
MELILNVQDKYLDDFKALISKLDYVEAIDSVLSNVEEPTVQYKKMSKRPSANQIEQMIIKKALKDAEAIERGELETTDLEILLAELDNEKTL